MDPWSCGGRQWHRKVASSCARRPGGRLPDRADAQNSRPDLDLTHKKWIPSLFENVVALDSKAHADYKLVPSQDFSFARDVLSAPLSAAEMVKAGREFPIFFPVTGAFLPVAQMGYRKDGNLYVDENGQWTARYIPAHVRRFPFVLGNKERAGEYVMMVNKDRISPRADGEPLFDGGTIPEGGIVDRARQFLIAFQKELEQTEALLKPLKDADILVPKVYTIHQGEKTLGSVRNLQVVDTEKLAGLDDVTLAGWVRSGLMGLVMAHLHSLDNWNSQKALSGLDAA